jgi:AcrR family transcriptional regulator
MTAQPGSHDSQGAPDRRVRKTRKALRDALIELILEEGYAAVTVQDIAARADVGRTTFYAHFVDKDDLLMSGLEDVHGPLGAEPLFGSSLSLVARQVLEHARREPALYRAVFGYHGAGPLRARMGAQVSEFVRRDLADRFPDADPIKVTMVARTTAEGFLGLVAWWLDGGGEASADSVASVVGGFADAAAEILGGRAPGHQGANP